MLTSGISFINFKVKSKISRVKKELRFLINQKNQVIISLSKNYKNNFNKKILIKYKFGKNSYEFIINDNKYSAKVFKFSDNTLFIDFSGTIEKFKIFTRANKFYIYNISSGNVIFSLNERLYFKNHYENKGSFLAPMPSKIEKIVVKENEKVKKGDPLIVLSSMKMENIIQSNITGHVNKIYVTKGQTVDSGTLLINLR